jgi:hypothetical protein
MKKARKKLILNRETIGQLTEDSLAGAAGGATLSCNTCGTATCPTQYCSAACPTQTDCVQTYRC